MIKNKKLAAPYLVWMVLFIAAPLAIVVYFAMTDKAGNFTLENLMSIGRYSSVFARSLILAAVATLICLVLSFPVGYFLSRMRVSKQKTAYEISLGLVGKTSGDDLKAFLAQSASMIALVALLACSMFPVLVNATADSVGPAITLANAASSELSLTWMTIILCIGLPLVLVYHVVIYRTFRGRVNPADLEEY